MLSEPERDRAEIPGRTGGQGGSPGDRGRRSSGPRETVCLALCWRCARPAGQVRKSDRRIQGSSDLRVLAVVRYSVRVRPINTVRRRASNRSGAAKDAGGRWSASNRALSSKGGWVSRVWVGDEYVVRLNNNGQFRDAYRHEATVVNLLAGSEVPHARILATVTARTGRGTLRAPARPNLVRRMACGGLAHAPVNHREPRLCVARTSPRSCPRRPAAALAGRRALRQTVACVPPTRSERGAPAGRGCATTARS